jgi:hypothetical protein
MVDGWAAALATSENKYESLSRILAWSPSSVQSNANSSHDLMTELRVTCVLRSPTRTDMIFVARHQKSLIEMTRVQIMV